MSDEKRQEIHSLLKEAAELVERATKIANDEQLDGFSFMGMTFRRYRESRYGDRHGVLGEPGWYTDEYWQSSTADCELWVRFPDEED